MSELEKILFVFIAYIVCLMIMRYRNMKRSREKVLCEFATDEGTGYEEFHPVTEGVLIVEATKKRAGAEYPIGNNNTITVDFPPNIPFFMSLIQVKVKKIILDEQTAEPLLNRSAGLNITAQRLYNRDRERFTALATGQSMVEEKRNMDMHKAADKKGGISWVWITVFLIVGIAIAGVVLYQDYLEATTKAALGVP